MVRFFYVGAVGKKEIPLQIEKIPDNPPQQDEDARCYYKPAAVKEIVESDVPSAGDTVKCEEGKDRNGCNCQDVVSDGIRQLEVEKAVNGPL